MSQNRYYYYDQEQCTFVEVQPDRSKTYRQAGITIGISLVLAFAMYIGFRNVFGSPETIALREENKALVEQLEFTEDQMQNFSGVLDDLAQQDRELYSTILGVEKLDEDVRQVGVGGVDTYESFNRYSAPTREVLRESASALDEIGRKMSLQENRLSFLLAEATKRQEMLKQLPAILPMKGRISSGYGLRIHPIYGNRRMHNGLDIAADIGTPVYAPGDGIVVFAGSRYGYGITVDIKHPTAGKLTRYAHLDEIKVKVGQRVSRGGLIALSGNTGRSTGPHLHYEVRELNGKVLDPVAFFAASMKPEEYRAIRETADNAMTALGFID